MPNHINRVLLVGAGYMAREYAKVLNELQYDYLTIGRSIEKAELFEKDFGKKVITGGLKNYLQTAQEKFDYAIITVNVEELFNSAVDVIKYGVKNILIEKPAGINLKEVVELKDLCAAEGVNMFVAYNRRFYSSVLHAKKIIEEDGGITSFFFEFTEWSHVVEKLESPEIVKNNWFFANSTHVVDLAFYLGGRPKELSTYTSGCLEWHPAASAFAGAGVSDKGALFSYSANWRSPGRWSVEIMTPRHRLYFKPMEQLHIQDIGSVAVNKVEVDADLDTKFKPGLYLQTKEFLELNKNALLSIEEHSLNFISYQKILVP